MTRIIERKVELPNGEIARVQVPADATNEEIQDFVMEQYDSGAFTKKGGVRPNAMTASPKAGTPQGDFPWHAKIREDSVLPFETVPFGNVPGAISEPIVSALAAMKGGAKAGYEAMYDLYKGDPNLSANVQQTIEESRYEPVSPGGRLVSQKFQEGVNRAFGPEGLDWIGTGERAGEEAFQRTGSPAIAAAYRTLPDYLSSVAGFRAAKDAPGMIRLKNPDGTPTKELESLLATQGLSYAALTQEVKNNLPALVPQTMLTGKPDISAKGVAGKDIAAGGTQAGLARFQQGAFGRTTKDPLATEAINIDMDEGVIQMIKTSDPQTRFNMLRLLKEHEAKTVNRGSDADPYAIVGDVLQSRVDFLDRQASQAGMRLDSIVQNRLAGQAVDAAPLQEAFQQLLDKLKVNYQISDELGIPVFVKENGKSALDFSTSVVAKDRGSIKMINDAAELMANRDVADAASLHLLKRQFDALIDWNKADKGGIPEQGRRFVKGLRATSNDILRTLDTEYAQVNDVLSTVLDAKGDLYASLVKSARELAEEGNFAAAGNDLRKLFSQYGKGYEQVEALKAIDAAVNKLNRPSGSKELAIPGELPTGGKTPEAPDMSSLYNMGEVILELDRLIGPTKRGNLQSAIAAGNEPMRRSIDQQRNLFFEKLYSKGTEKFRVDPAMAERQRKLDVYRIMQELIRERGAQ